MGLAPSEHLQAYRTSGNSVFFGIPGTTSNAVGAVSVSSGGTYTGVPSVSASGGGGSGFIGSANMGIKTISFTPQSVAGSDVSVTSQNGTGAQFSTSFGAPDILGGSVYFNPNSYSLSVTGGAGAAYRIWYPIHSVLVASTGGAYSSEPTLSVSGNATLEPRFKFATATFSSGIFYVMSGMQSCFGTPSTISVIGNYGGGSGFYMSMLYRPKQFSMAPHLYSDALYWHPADTLPTFSISPQTSGSGVTLTPRFMLSDGSNINVSSFTLTNPGAGYDDGCTISITGGGLPAGMTVTGTIGIDGDQLDLSTLSLDGASHLSGGDLNEWRGYFSSLPTVTLTPLGSAPTTPAVLSISKMRLVKISASSGSGYTQTDIGLLSTTGKITNTGNIRNFSGDPVSPNNFSLEYAEVYSGTITNKGSNYAWGETLGWTSASFFTLANGAPTITSEPAITTTREISGVAVIDGGYYSTQSNPSVTITAPPSGGTPAFSVVGLVDSVENTARGSGYSSPQITSSGFYTNPQLTSSANPFSTSGIYVVSISVTNPGTGYMVGDEVVVGGTAFPVSELKVVSVSRISGGLGYTSAPAISFSGGGQTVAAVATATISGISSSTSSLPGLSLADVNLSTGDARRIAMELAECFYGIFQKDASVVGTRVLADKNIGFSPTGLRRDITYRFEFQVEMSGAQTLIPEA